MNRKHSNENIAISVNGRLGTTDRRSMSDTILRLIWKEHEISRAEIAKRLNLSRSTVTEIIKELVNTCFVSEVGSGESSGGRRPIILQFQDDSKFILGVDIGATHVSVVLTNLRGKLLSWREKEYPVRDDPEGTRNLVYELSEECLNEVENGSAKLISVGVSVPSPIDPNNPELIPNETIPSWRGESGLKEMKEHFNVPVYIDNDANLGALAEYYWGAGRGFNDMIFIKIAKGIGAGYILDGKIYRGAKGIAGELSHLPIDRNGALCGCGLKGCLITFLAIWAYKLRIQELKTSFPDSILCNTNDEITIGMIENLALEGDTLALKIVGEAADSISIAVASLINMMNPSLIVIGGSFAILEDLLLAPIRSRINQVNLVKSVSLTEIKTSELGTKAIAIGAATFAIEETFTEKNFFKINCL